MITEIVFIISWNPSYRNIPGVTVRQIMLMSVKPHDYKSKPQTFLSFFPPQIRRKTADASVCVLLSCAVVRGSRNISFGGEDVKGQKRKVMSVIVTLIQQHIPWEVGGSGSGWRETGAVSDSLIQFYYLFES